MASDPETTKKLVLALIDRLIDLETERIAMAGILQNVKTQYSLPLDWRSEVRSHCYPEEIIRGAAVEKYAQLRQSVFGCASDTQTVSVLELIPKDRAWEMP
jgi:hypothetical protein